MKKSLFFYLFFACGLSSFAQIPNADFSQWQNNEPTNWLTNNLYDSDKKFTEAFVIPASGKGAKLLVKKIAHTTEEPAVVSYYGGKIESRLIPMMIESGKSIQLSFDYEFKSDSADVLKAQITLESRNTHDGTLTPNKRCDCQLKNDTGGEIITLPATESRKIISLKAIFSNNTEPNKVPVGCMMYVWKIKFWLENTSTHPHENTYAIIEKIQL